MYHIHSDAAWATVFGRHHRLVYAEGSRLAIVNTLEASLCVDALNEAITKYGPARDHEYRSGKPVHILCLDRLFATIWRAYLDGRQIVASWKISLLNACGGH